MLKTKKEIEDWLDSQCDNIIGTYKIDDNLIVDIYGTIRLNNLSLHELPFKFGTIKGSFYCEQNKLSSFKNFPDVIETSLYLDYNEFTSLIGCPEVGESIMVNNNKLISLEGSPKRCEAYFYCMNNNLTSLEGCPEYVRYNFLCHNNSITSLEHSPKEVGSSFNCTDNLIKDISNFKCNLSTFIHGGKTTNRIHGFEKFYKEVDLIPRLKEIKFKLEIENKEFNTVRNMIKLEKELNEKIETNKIKKHKL